MTSKYIPLKLTHISFHTKTRELTCPEFIQFLHIRLLSK